MRNILKVLILLIWVGNSYMVKAQKPKDFYVSYPQTNGMLFHVFPVTFFQHKTDGDLTFDITYQCGRDSAVINFTYYASQPQALDSVRFLADKALLSGKAEKLFIEAENTKKWTHRYSLKVPVKYLFSFFSPTEKPCVSLYSDSTIKNYILKESEWSKKVPMYQTVMRTIRMGCEK